MKWLLRSSWWGLLAITALFAVSGLLDVATGATWQAEDVTGSTSAEIAAQSSTASELIDFGVRTQGVGLIALGVVLCAVLLFAYRQGRPWAWWTMWTLPALAIANSLLMHAFGAWGPGTTAMYVGVVAALFLLLGAPSFFRRAPQTAESGSRRGRGGYGGRINAANVSR